jgi:exosome complex component RRP45
MAGKLVWNVRVDIHALDDCGDLIGCCSIAAITALTHFRRPDVTVSGEDVTIHSLDERNPVPLSIHHKPVCILFAFFNKGERLLCDPTNKEESVMEGHVVVAMNKHREVCCMQLGGGVALQPEEILRCTSIAVVKVMEITEKIDSALLRDERIRKGEVVTMETDDVDLITKSEKEQVDIQPVDEPIIKDNVAKWSSRQKNESKVTVLGHGTAIIGHEGSSQWEMNGEDSVLEINGGRDVKAKQKRKKAKKTESVAEVVQDCGSDEEETVMLTGDDVIGKKSVAETEKPLVVEEKGSGVIDLTAALKKKKDRHGKKGKKDRAKNS